MHSARMKLYQTVGRQSIEGWDGSTLMLATHKALPNSPRNDYNTASKSYRCYLQTVL